MVSSPSLTAVSAVSAVGDPRGEEHITLALCHHTPLIRLTVGGG